MKEYNFWNGVKNFSKNEFGPYPEKMDKNFIIFLDALRDFLGCSMNILCSHGSGSVKNSMHPHGMAVDVYFDSSKDPFDIFLRLIRFRKPGYFYEYLGGIGVYLGVWHKHINGEKIEIIGFHLDVRPIKNNKISLWGAIPPPGNDIEMAALLTLYPNLLKFKRTEKQIYVPMDERFWR